MPPRLAFAVPGDLDARTGGTIYDRRLIQGLRDLGWDVDHLAWPGSFPFPSPADEAEAAASLAALPDGALAMVDGLAFGAMPHPAQREAGRLRLVALVHHPLALETGFSPGDQQRLAACERAALACARAVITTSRTTAAILAADYAVEAAKITVVIPGVDKPLRPRARQLGPARLFSLGSVTPRKAHHILVEALSGARDLDWRCVIAGSDSRSPDTAGALRRQIAALGLEGRIALVGEVSDAEVARLYAEADIFVLASLYEGYGMVLAEALSWGLPIVAARGGAVAEVVGRQAGVLVEPADVAGLNEALKGLLLDPPRRLALAAGALRAAQDLPSWDDAAATMARVLHRL